MFKYKNLIYNLYILNKYLKKKQNNKNILIINILFKNILLYNIFLNNIYLNIKHINNKVYKTKFFEIEKGLKKKKLGIYLRNFSKDFFFTENISKYCYLIIRFARKNLFLTLLNNKGNVVCKTNIGSCGFKKKVKFTGYAIKRTSKKFSKKILKLFVKTIFLIFKNNKKSNIKTRVNTSMKVNLIKNLNLFSKFEKFKIKKLKSIKLKKIRKLFERNKKMEKNKRNKKMEKNKRNKKMEENKRNKKMEKNKRNKKMEKNKRNKKMEEKKKKIILKFWKNLKTELSKEDNEKRNLDQLIILDKKQETLNKISKFNSHTLNMYKNYNLLLNKNYNYFNINIINNKIIILKKFPFFNIIKNKKINYRNYFFYKNKLSENLNIKVRVKSSLKFWGFKFLMYGLGKKFYWFKGLDIKIPIPHSEGLRLKKKEEFK